jgi:hypothetical protein
VIKKIILLVALIASLTACRPVGSDGIHPTPKVPHAASQAPLGHVVSDLDDRSVVQFSQTCEELEDAFLKNADVITEPCVFQDSEKNWRIDISWDQDLSMSLDRCTHEDKSDSYPCIWINDNKIPGSFKYTVYLP